MICLHINRKAHVACYFNYLFEAAGLLIVIVSDVYCTCGNISETGAIHVDAANP